MMKFNNFHEEDFDGVVLKLPNWFIKMNMLDGLIDEIENRLKQDPKFSLMAPDHVRNLFELEERKNKKEILAKKEELRKNQAEADRKYQQRLTRREIIKTSFRVERFTGHSFIDSDAFIGDKRIEYKDVFTTRSNSIRAQFQRYGREALLDKNLREEFLLSCEHYLLISLLDEIRECDYSFPKEPFYQSSYGELGIRVNLKHIELRSLDGKYLSHQTLRFSKEKQIFYTNYSPFKEDKPSFIPKVESEWEGEKIFPLTDYEEDGIVLRKKI